MSEGINLTIYHSHARVVEDLQSEIIMHENRAEVRICYPPLPPPPVALMIAISAGTEPLIGTIFSWEKGAIDRRTPRRSDCVAPPQITTYQKIGRGAANFLIGTREPIKQPECSLHNLGLLRFKTLSSSLFLLSVLGHSSQFNFGPRAMRCREYLN